MTESAKTFSIRRLRFGNLLSIGWAITGVLLWFSVINMLDVNPDGVALIVIFPAQLGILLGVVLFPLSVCYMLYRGYKILMGKKGK